MEITCVILAVLLLILGFVGCVLPILPGPAISYMAFLVLVPTRFAPSLTVAIGFLLACIVVHVLDFAVPAVGARKFKSSRWGVYGCIAGTLIGLGFGLLGLLLGPFIGAFLGEMISGRNFRDSLNGGVGAFLGFLAGVLIKIVYCAVCAGWCIYAFYQVLTK